MIVSHKKKFIMLLPWKTASQTAVMRLAAFQDSPYDQLFDFNPHLNRVVHQHLTCADLACLPESKLGYLVASFVRNPYDRVYSGFRELEKDIREQSDVTRAYPEPWIRDHVMKQLAENLLQLIQAQFQFDRWLDLVGDDQIYEIGRNTNFLLHPCHYWTHIGDQQVAQFIGRVENFEADFRRFLTLVDIDASELPTGNANVVDLEGSAASSPFGYRYVDRMNPRSIEKINRLFQRDFEIFGYNQVDVSSIHGAENHPLGGTTAAAGNLLHVSPRLLDGSALLCDMFLKREQELHRRELDVLRREAKLSMIQKLLPVRFYRSIRSPITKFVGRAADRHRGQREQADA